MSGLIDLTAIREGIADRLEAIGIRATWFIPSKVEPPCAVVSPGDQYVNWHGSFSTAGHCELSFQVTLLMAPQSTDESIQTQLDEWASGVVANSIELVQTAPDGTVGPNLGINGCSVMVRDFSGLQTVSANGLDYPAVQLNVVVYQSKVF